MSYLYNTPAYNKHKETLVGKRNPIINTECNIEFVNQEDFLAVDDEETFKELCAFLENYPIDSNSSNNSTSVCSGSDFKAIGDGNKRKFGDSDYSESTTDLSSLDAMSCSRNNITDTAALLQELKRQKKEVAKIKKRIPDDDIRRRIAPIFADAFNKCDKSIFDDLLNKYATHDCMIVYRYVGKENPYGPSYVEVMGREAIAGFWDTLFCSIPDAIFELHETKIRVLATDFSSISCKFVFTGTKLFSISGDDHQAVHYTSATSGGSNDSTSPAHGNSSSVSSITNFPNHVDRESPSSVGGKEIVTTDAILGSSLKQSMNVTLVGTLVFYVNPDKQVHKFEFAFCVKQ